MSGDPVLLERFDADERYAAVFPDIRREALPNLVRHVDLVCHSGAVIFSRLSRDTLDSVVCEQIGYFRSLGQDFEWKAYAHDQPPDLVARLTALGFEAEPTEAVMVLDLESMDTPPVRAVVVRQLETRADLADVAAVKERVYEKDAPELLNRLAFELDNAPGHLSVYVAYVDDVPAATAWVRFPKNSAFASLWGGSTLPELRNRGLYTALLAARLDEARQRGYRYATVDAGAMSRPILAKRGFRVLTYATACTWHGRADTTG